MKYWKDQNVFRSRVKPSINGQFITLIVSINETSAWFKMHSAQTNHLKFINSQFIILIVRNEA